jgi:hypothetical protein
MGEIKTEGKTPDQIKEVANKCLCRLLGNFGMASIETSWIDNVKIYIYTLERENAELRGLALQKELKIAQVQATLKTALALLGELNEWINGESHRCTNVAPECYYCNLIIKVNKLLSTNAPNNPRKD